MMSVRGSRPKIASDTVTEPAFLPSRVLTWSSMSLPLLRFLAGTRDLRPVLHFVRPALSFGQLPNDAAVNDVGAWLKTKNSVRHGNRACFFAVEGTDLELHVTPPSSVSCRRSCPLHPSAPLV